MVFLLNKLESGTFCFVSSYIVLNVDKIPKSGTVCKSLYKIIPLFYFRQLFLIVTADLKHECFL